MWYRKFFRYVCANVVLAIMTIGLFTPGINTQAYAATLDCSTASNINIPIVECQALLDFYDSTGGPSWHNNTNRDTDTDICTWYGISCTNVAGQRRILRIILQGNNLIGTLPASLDQLIHIQTFNIFSNQVTGELPESRSSR